MLQVTVIHKANVITSVHILLKKRFIFSITTDLLYKLQCDMEF